MVQKRRIIDSIAVCFALFFEQLNIVFHLLFRLVGLGTGYTTEVLVLVLFVFLAYMMATNFRSAFYSLTVPIIIGILYLTSYLILGDNFNYAADNVTEKLFLYCIPTFMVLYCAKDTYGLDSVMKFFSTLIVFSLAVQIILRQSGSDLALSLDYQSVSYCLMIPFVYFACKLDRKWYELLLAAVTFVFLLFFGGRGPLICALVCILYLMIRRIKKRKLLIIPVIILLVAFYMVYDSLLAWVAEFADANGFSGGSILKYTNMGDVYSDSSRSQIYEMGFEIACLHPLSGAGFASDRFYLGEYGFKYGNYPHNIALELWIHFGFILGTILFALIIYLIVVTFKKGRAAVKEFPLFEICFMSTGFMILLFSGSYVTSPMFFGMLAIMIKNLNLRFTR